MSSRDLRDSEERVGYTKGLEGTRGGIIRDSRAHEGIY